VLNNNSRFRTLAVLRRVQNSSNGVGIDKELGALCPYATVVGNVASSTEIYLSSPHVGYHVESGCSRTNSVGVSWDPKKGNAGYPPPWVKERRWSPETPLPAWVTMPNGNL